jgi:hypothetical protein
MPGEGSASEKRVAGAATACAARRQKQSVTSRMTMRGDAYAQANDHCGKPNNLKRAEGPGHAGRI